MPDNENEMEGFEIGKALATHFEGSRELTCALERKEDTTQEHKGMKDGNESTKVRKEL